MTNFYYYKKQLNNIISGYKRVLHLKKCASKGIILYSNDLNNSGAPTFLLSIKTYLLRNGFKVAIISRDYGMLEKEFQSFSSYYLFNYRGRGIFRILKRKGYNKIILNVISTFENIDFFIKEQFKTFSISHESIETTIHSPYKDVVKKAILYSDFFYVPSADEMKKYSAYYSNKNIRVINFSLPNEFNNNNRIHNIRKIVGSVSCADPIYKGIYNFIRLATLIPYFDFIWVGYFSNDIKNKFIVEYGQFPINIKFVNPDMNKSQLSFYYKKMDYLVSFSLHETFGLSLLEGLYCGCKVITYSSLGGIASDPLYSKFIYLVKNNDPILFAEKITNIQNKKNSLPIFKKELVNSENINDVILNWAY